jgi:uncharacterized protein with ParB-like and HNH nuclease domain
MFTSRYFFIPDYQRSYAWQKTQLDDYWLDISFLVETYVKMPEKSSHHFMGNLLLRECSTRATTKGLRELQQFEVVDGQQRLTTTILLLQALKQEFNKMDFDLSDLTEQYLLTTLDNDDKLCRLTLNSDTRDFFKAIFSPLSRPTTWSVSAQKRLLTAIQTFEVYIVILRVLIKLGQICQIEKNVLRL